MAQFPPAYDYVMRFEDPEKTYASATDNNGAGVISGINQASFPSDFAFINSIIQPQRGPAIARFYDSRFWTPLMLGGLESQDVANRVMDAAVDMGPSTGVKLLQEAVNALHGGSVGVDGLMGPQTREATNARDPEALLAAFRTMRGDYYRQIVASRPEDEKYLPGWLRRAEA